MFADIPGQSASGTRNTIENKNKELKAFQKKRDMATLSLCTEFPCLE